MNNSDSNQLDADALVARGIVLNYQRIGRWVRFIALTGFVLSGLSFVGLAIALFGQASLRQRFPMTPEFQSASLVGAFVIGCGAATILIPSVILNRFASAISGLVRSQSRADLNFVCKRQQTAWIAITAFFIMYGIAISVATVSSLSSK